MMNSGRYVRHTEQLLQLCTDRVVDFNKVRVLFKTFANHFIALHVDDKPNLQLELIDLEYSD